MNTRSGGLAFPDIMSMQNIGVRGVKVVGEHIALTVGARKIKGIVVIYQDKEDKTHKDSTQKGNSTHALTAYGV